MTRIERIQPSLHKKDRVLVYLTGGRLLRITPEELLRFDLRPGMDLAEDVLEELRRAAARSQTRQRAAELAAGRMLSRKELSDRLVKKGADPREAQETAQWLADLGAVDDAAYAGVIVRHYAAMGYGPGRVRQELQHRGVPRELWDDALARMPDPEEAIDRFLTAKLRGKTPDRATLQRLSAALQRRGFQWQDIRPALARLDREPED
jgi:regulatory protein